MNYRTDLADESHSIQLQGNETQNIEGVHAQSYTLHNFHCTKVCVETEVGAKRLGKPVGTYITLDLNHLIRREEDAFENAAACLSEIIQQLIGDFKGSILIAGLGNAAITPDAIGPLTTNQILVTRHLKAHMPDMFSNFREVAAIDTGVLGTTGLESADLIAAICAEFSPDLVIVVDALASAHYERLCSSVQLTDAGIVPGSGVGNARAAINRDFLHVPVLALGVPTVIDAETLYYNIAGSDAAASALDAEHSLIVTPRDIDARVRDISKLLGYGINLALHPGLQIKDIDLLIS